MADAVLSVVACVLALGALARVRDLGPGVPAGRRSVAVAVVSLAAGTATLTPLLYNLLQDLTGVPSIQEPLARTAIMVAALSAQSIFLFSADGDAAGVMVRRRVVVLLAAVVALWAAFAAADARMRTNVFLIRYGEDPWVGVYLVIYLVFLGWSFIGLLRAWRRLSTEVTGSLRAGLRLLALVHLTRVACVFLGAATGLLAVAGVLWSSIREVGDVLTGWVRAYRAKERLYPLWRDLARLRPEIVLEPVPGAVRERLHVRDVRWRLYRRVIEIRDGRLALLPYLRAVRQRRANRVTTPDGAMSPATQEGQALALAVLSARRDPEPMEASAPVDQALVLEGVDGEVAYLTEVSRAYSETVRAVEADSGREPDPGEVSS